MTCSILVGGAWGDEGKGKCITYVKVGKITETKLTHTIF